jgi:hypothetical protein
MPQNDANFGIGTLNWPPLERVSQNMMFFHSLAPRAASTWLRFHRDAPPHWQDRGLHPQTCANALRAQRIHTTYLTEPVLSRFDDIRPGSISTGD